MVQRSFTRLCDSKPTIFLSFRDLLPAYGIQLCFEDQPQSPVFERYHQRRESGLRPVPPNPIIDKVRKSEGLRLNEEALLTASYVWLLKSAGGPQELTSWLAWRERSELQLTIYCLPRRRRTLLQCFSIRPGRHIPMRLLNHRPELCS